MWSTSRRMTGAAVVFAALTVLIPGCAGYSVDQASLEILPATGTFRVAVGKSQVLTCKANVPNVEEIRNLQWLDSQNRTIAMYSSSGPRPAMYTQVAKHGSIPLLLTAVTENMAGTYFCTASYANTNMLSTSVSIETYVEITWTNAPLNQYPIVGKDAKIMCEVTARPSATVDWLRDGQQIYNSEHYVIEVNGLLIKSVQESDDGVYTCRAYVVSTGELADRNIKVEVHTLPIMEGMETDVEIKEGETTSISCRANSKPPPVYSWSKKSDKADLSTTDRFSVNKNTGLLTMNRVERGDTGEYICEASNQAGHSQTTIRVTVIVPPRIYDVTNVTVEVKKTAKLVCKATGHPSPSITFMRFGTNDEMIIGAQPNDNRIVLENRNQETAEGETVGTLILQDLTRADDGLYACVASNKGGRAYKNGHLTVEFPPEIVVSQSPPLLWSWNHLPVNITCLAESIPNATIEWRSYDMSLMNQNDPNMLITSSGPSSTLHIIPREQKYYRHYRCIAVNRLGRVEHNIELRQARVPGCVPQATLSSLTATTINFTLVAPAEELGPRIRGFAVRYREHHNLDFNMNKTWSVDSQYIIENLIPLSTYTFQFAAENQVGIGDFNCGATQTYTMPRKAAPETPQLLIEASAEENDIGAVQSIYADHFELRWKKPADNGEPIDFFQVRYCPVHKVNGEWSEPTESEYISGEINLPDATTYEMRHLQADTYYVVRLAAHNFYGLSKQAVVYVRTARGMDTMPGYHSPTAVLSSTTIIIVVVCGVLACLLIIDLILFCGKRQGVIATICGKRAKKHNDDEAKLGSLYGWRFPLPYCSSAATCAARPPSPAPLPPPVRLVATPTDEKEPLRDCDRTPVFDDSMKRNTSVEFDGSKVYATTGGHIIGKNSAV